MLCITNNSIKRQTFVYTHLKVETVLFQTIQFSISTQCSSIWPIDRALSGATALGQSRPRSDGNKGVLHIPQNSRLFSVISRTLVEGVLHICRDAVGVFYNSSRLGQTINEEGIEISFWCHLAEAFWSTERLFFWISVLVFELASMDCMFYYLSVEIGISFCHHLIKFKTFSS